MNLETTHYWRQSHGDLTWWHLKLETLKTMGTPRKIDAILLNIKTNRAKLVSVCRYKLATYWQHFTEIYLTRVKILQKVLGGLLFWLTLYSRSVITVSYGDLSLRTKVHHACEAAVLPECLQAELSVLEFCTGVKFLPAIYIATQPEAPSTP